MTDRIDILTVVLERDIRDDDIQPLVDAIRLLQGVLDVVPHVADHFSDATVPHLSSAFAVDSRVRHELHGRLLDLARSILKG